MAKTKALISFAATAKLICVFVFAFAKSRVSHDAAHMNLIKPAFAYAKTKSADHLRDNRAADQCLCFLYIDSTIPVLPKSKILSL